MNAAHASILWLKILKKTLNDKILAKCMRDMITALSV